MGASKTIQSKVDGQLPPEILRELSRTNGWISIAHLLFEWSSIFIAAYAGSQTIWLYPLAVVWIGARQHALAILLHDAAHYRVHSHRKINNSLAEVFLAMPLFVTLNGYRESHVLHHQNTNTEEDPDWVTKDSDDWTFPKTRWQLAWMLTKIACGLNTFKMIKLAFRGGRAGPATQTGPKSKTHRIRLFVYLCLAVLFSWFGLWEEIVLFWLIPLFTWFQVALRIRSIAEHFAIDYSTIYSSTRTTHPGILGKLFIAPKNVGFHLDHHLYPSVPFFRLGALHRELLKLPGYGTQAHITHGYFRVLRECVALSSK